MKIIYCHHAERNINPKKLRSQNDDITENGIKDAELVAERLSSQKITAIYTSPFLRCKKTAQIINRQFNVPIYEEERFNEIGSVEGEDWKDGLQRTMQALDNISNKFNDDDTILCVTSGINLSGFVCWNLKEKPHKNFPFMGAENCSPIMFYDRSNLSYREKTFERPYIANRYRKDKRYKIIEPTFGEMKAQLKLELKRQTELMHIFTDKTRRENHLMKLGELERARDLGEIEVRKYLANRLALDSFQLIKDIATCENIDPLSIQSTTALDLSEERCIENFTAFVERLFYVDTNIQETLMLIYSTIVSYINYNEISYEDVMKYSVIEEDEKGSYTKGKFVCKI
ncbi:MAG: histidine phosphatase family protein [Clostridiales bacterium]|nr:histidine phosphatase family protein [Clostridiales bacterium]